MKHPPFIGQFVKSHYRASWVGMIMDFEINGKDSHGYYASVAVLILRDQYGRVPRKRIVKSHLGYGWMGPADPVDLTGINPDWLKPPKGKTWDRWTWSKYGWHY